MSTCKPRCTRCGQIHPSDAAVRHGRWAEPVRWRATVDGAPIRGSRKEAERDWCDRAREVWG